MTFQLMLLLASLVVLAWWAYSADKQKKEEARQAAFRAKLTRFKDVYFLMPEFIKALWKDLSNPQKKLVRDFFIVSKGIAFEGGSGAFIYYTEDIPGLEAKVGVLQDNGYVADVTPYNVKKYHMSEELVELIQQAARQ